ncbi:hypothetical protein POJ06DRAFT_55264 [Lipomyces tetrasporus]|uniref:DUF3020 domain-containing protein n=1 Tax=Lipomyces tetrasporus TaxID=54092 RepID=A0AAD7QWY9_9ASCO|nr:uncharacterized protein POJ06DRAFT_55264 [Lipomyces tetrasporus]KAJ8102766.1 hypothetical protein POJ06DRAFT_55264 [Lipomyces tetrasporus]
MNSDRGHASLEEETGQHIDETDALHQQLQQLHQQLQEEAQELQGDTIGIIDHFRENADLDPGVSVTIVSKEDAQHDVEARHDSEQEHDQIEQQDGEEGDMELSEELQMHVAQLALELQQQGLGTLSAEELQQHLMAQLASGQLSLPHDAAEQENAVTEAEVEPEQEPESRHQVTPETAMETLPSSMPERMQVPIPEPLSEPIPGSIPEPVPESLPEPLQAPSPEVEPSSAMNEDVVVDPALRALSTAPDEGLSGAEVQESQVDAETEVQYEVADEGAEDATTTLERLNELILGMDLSDPAAAIAQLQSATNIDPTTLLQAVTTALSSIIEGGEEALDEAEGEFEEVGPQPGEEGAPLSRRKRIRKRLPPRNEEERQKLKIDNRERKKRWRMRNDERNKDNDLRVRVNRRADRMFGPERSEKKSQWIENEFARRRQRRMQRLQRSLGATGSLGNLFGQGGVGDELQAALAEIVDREGDIEKFNNTLLQLARDPNLIKNLTGMLQQMSGLEADESDSAPTKPHHFEDYTETDAQGETAPADTVQAETEEGIIDPALLGSGLNDDNSEHSQLGKGSQQEQLTEQADPKRTEGIAEIPTEQAARDAGCGEQSGSAVRDDTGAEVTMQDEQPYGDLESAGRGIQPVDLEAAAQAVASFGDLDFAGTGIDESLLLQAFNLILANGILPDMSTGAGENSDADGQEKTSHPTESIQAPEEMTIDNYEGVDHEGTIDSASKTTSDISCKRARDSEDSEKSPSSGRRTSQSPTSDRALTSTSSSAQSPAVPATSSSKLPRLTEPFLPSHFVAAAPSRPAYVLPASKAPLPPAKPVPYGRPLSASGLTSPPMDDNPDRKKKVKAMGFPPMLKPLAPPISSISSSSSPRAHTASQD